MKKLTLLFLLIATPCWARPFPVGNEINRAAPLVCPTDTIPKVNAQGTSGAPVAITTAAEVVAGNANRPFYAFESDAAACANYGTSSNTAASPAPVGAAPCTSGWAVQANTLYFEDNFPGNRLDMACVTGTCNVSTIECNP